MGSGTSESNERTMDVKNKANRNAQIKEPSKSFFFFFRLQNPLYHFNWDLIRFLKEELDIKMHEWNIKPEEEEEDAHYKVW
jgi:hypothetical protein